MLYQILGHLTLRFAFIFLAVSANFDGALAETPEIRMDRLIATYPYYQDAQDRKDALPGLMDVWPKISDKEDYSAGSIVKTIREYEVAADQLKDTACGIDIALMGYDPGRGTMPLIAINRTYSCGVDAEVAVLQKYLKWLPTF